MRFIVTGSGGCVCTPKPTCRCGVCVEARVKGRPYARCGCGLYLEDIALLVDTPEDVASALNFCDVQNVEYVAYSHWDPDHTLGMRIFEQLRLEWLDYYENIPPKNPITVLAQAGTMDDINGIRNPYGPFLEYYERMGLIKRRTVDDHIEVNGVKISFVPVDKNKSVTVFVFESDGKKLIYAPCDCVPFPEAELLYGADALVIGNTYIGEVLKNGRTLSPGHPLRGELHSLEGVLEIKKRLAAKRAVITHIEEDWGKSYGDYVELEKQYDDLRFAYDGMIIEV